MKALIGVVGLVALAACGGDDGGEPTPIDAALTDGVSIDGDGDAQVRECTASPATPATPTTGGSPLGAWNLTWSCMSGCVGNRPALTYSRHAEITSSEIAYSSASCPRCALTHEATPAMTGCLDVAAGADFDAQCRFSYRLCEQGGGVDAVVTWKEPGLSEQVWRARGVR